jgi:hypothetical protein
MTGDRWEVLEQAAARLEFTASRATPGLWWRPLRLRSKTMILADIPRDEELTSNGRENVVVVMVQSLRNGRFMRRRSGRDLEYIAMTGPLVGKGLADILRCVAKEMETTLGQDKEGFQEPESWGAALRAAHRVLKTGEKKRFGE